MADLDKVKVAKVLADSAHALRSVTAERDKLASEVLGLRRHEDASKLASVMHEKGLNLDVEYDVLVEDLEKAAADGRFPVIEEAVNMAGPNMGAQVHTTNDEGTGGGGDALSNFLLGGVG